MTTTASTSSLPNTAQPRVVVIPVAYGAEAGLAQGPRAVLEASRRIESFDDELGYEPFAVGVAAAAPLWDEPPFANTERAVGDTLDRGQFPIVLGGEHSLALGAVRAVWKRNQDLAVVQISAGLQLKETPENPYVRHSFAARVRDYGLPVVQVGARAATRSEVEKVTDASGVFWARHYRGATGSGRAWDIPDVLAAVPERPLYLSIDLGVLDPGVFPGSGTLEPGGLGWYPLIELVRQLFVSREVLACDLAEVVPIPGQPHSERLAARLLHKLVGYRFWRG